MSWVELCAEWTEDDVPIDALAHLVSLAQSPNNRDAMMMQFAFGAIVGEAITERNERSLALQRERGGSMDDVVGAQIAAGEIDLDDELDGLIMGRGTIRPEPDRVKRAIMMLSFATAHLPDPMKPAPLCMLSWLSWSLGLGSAAGAFADAALAIDPEYGMGLVLHLLYEGGRIPDWAFQHSQPER